MKKVFRKIHLWLAVPFGIVITLVCFSGAMLVFEAEVNELSRPHLYRVEAVNGSPLPLDRLLERVAATLPDSVSITGVTISADARRTYQVNLSKPRRASIYVDPYTGEVKGKGGRSGFFMTMFRLHRWLLDSMNPGSDGIFWGKTIVGVSTLLFVFVLLSGAVIWLPRTAKALKNSLKISVRKGWKRFFYDLHVAGGVYSLLFLLAMALTGLTWSFPWYRTLFYRAFGVEVQAQAHGAAGHQGASGQHGVSGHQRPSPGEREGRSQGGSAPRRTSGAHSGPSAPESGRQRERRGERADFAPGKEAPAQAPFAHWQQVYDQLRSENPTCEQISLSPGSASVSFDRLGNQRAADRYTFDPQSGAIIGAEPYAQQEKAGKLRGWIYSVHVGSWGGTLTRLLTFFAALVGATLPLTGYYFWLKRVWKKRKRKRAEAAPGATR